MNLAQQYAKAIFDTEPKPATVFKALQKRGHEKLTYHILHELEKLVLAKKRSEHYKKVTPAVRQTKTLLELYKTLIA